MHSLHLRNTATPKVYVYREGSHTPSKIFYSAAKAKDWVLGRRMYGECWEIGE